VSLGLSKGHRLTDHALQIADLHLRRDTGEKTVEMSGKHSDRFGCQVMCRFGIWSDGRKA
jgi:hypothetical protein